jgi:hypothetical protein
MLGVPEDLDLSVFLDTLLVQLALGEYQIGFHFQPEGYIGVEGYWELRSATGELIDQGKQRLESYATRDFHVQTLLGHVVSDTDIDPPNSFTLVFDNGHRLTIFDDSEPYESFSIQPGNIFV